MALMIDENIFGLFRYLGKKEKRKRGESKGTSDLVQINGRMELL
jgi:hypothetical protein